MKLLRLDGITLVWLILSFMTVFSWILGTQEDGSEISSHTLATIGILIVSFFKVRLVIMHFMEVRAAPMALRLILESWVLGICSILIVIYMTGWGAAPSA
tara:strand:- start:70 stop:369 length:300 start_codon:yes stop_codon:yes gene_type:complete